MGAFVLVLIRIEAVAESGLWTVGYKAAELAVLIRIEAVAESGLLELCPRRGTYVRAYPH